MSLIISNDLISPKNQEIDNEELSQFSLSDAEKARKSAENLKTKESIEKYNQILANTYVKGLGMSYPIISGQQGAFEQTYDSLTNETVKLLNLMHTMVNERVMQPDFGLNLEQYLFENITPDLIQKIEAQVKQKIETWIPNVAINTLKAEVVFNEALDRNKIYVTISFGLKANPSETDVITFQF